VRTEGTWVGIAPDVTPFMVNQPHRLAPGDVLVLYTDGVTESRRPVTQEQFGIERVLTILDRLHDAPAADICTAIFDATRAWAPEQEDDRTLIVLRYRS